MFTKKTLKIIFAVAIIAFVGVFGFGRLALQFLEGAKAIARLKEDTSVSLASISFYAEADLFQAKELFSHRTNTDEARSIFLQGLRQMQRNHPGKGDITDRYQVVIRTSDAQRLDFRFHTRPTDQGSVFLMLVRRAVESKSVHIDNQGEFRSAILGSWLAEQGITQVNVSMANKP